MCGPEWLLTVPAIRVFVIVALSPFRVVVSQVRDGNQPPHQHLGQCHDYFEVLRALEFVVGPTLAGGG